MNKAEEVVKSWKARMNFLHSQLGDGLITLDEYFDTILTISAEAKIELLNLATNKETKDDKVD